MKNEDSQAPVRQTERGLSVHRPLTISVNSPRDRRELAWSELFAILKTNRWLSIAIIFFVLLATAIGTLFMRPEFEATARLEIDAPNPQPFSLRDSSNFAPSDPDYLETQTQILRSQGLAMDVIRKLHLDWNPDIVNPSDQKPSVLRTAAGRIKNLLGWRAPETLPTTAGESDAIALTARESKALAVYEKNLSVGAVRDSKLVSIRFSSPDPRLAAKIVNTLTDEYIERNYRTRYEIVTQETRWLSKELDDLRDKVEKSNQALADFQNSNGIVSLKENENTTTQTVEQLTQLLNTAKGDRIQLEAEVKTLDHSGVDTLQQTRSNNLVMELSKMLAAATSSLAQARAIYGEKNANVTKYQNQVDELTEELNTERNRIAQSLRASYNSAVAREQLLTHSLDGMSGKIHEMNKTEVQNSSLKKQVQVNEDLYNALFAKLKEAGISAGLRSSTIRIVDRALIPDDPIKPKLRLNLALGFLLALVLAIGAPVLKELRADRVHSPEDLRKLTGLSPIGVVPMFQGLKNKRMLRSSANGRLCLSRWEEMSRSNAVYAELGMPPQSIGAEAVRNLCTFMKLSQPQTPPRVILVTSAIQGEGKTTVAARLARVLAETNPTCLVDADLRNPSAARVFGFTSQCGLSEVLSGSVNIEAVARGIRGARNLTIVPGGSGAIDPGQLVSSKKMREVVRTLLDRFQNIVIDSPPILPFADARAISRFVDGVLVVTRSGLTASDHLKGALEVLAELHAPFLGIVLNGVHEASSYYKPYRASYACATEK